MAEPLTTLYRPVGRKELELIRASGFRGFPPRLPAQPFFYPVLSEEYAIQIARDWNTKDEVSGYEGHVLKFDVRTQFLSRYEIRVVGNSSHREYWIPAGDLEHLNRNIDGTIRIIHSFRQWRSGMLVSAEVVRTHFDYSMWASSRLLDAAAQLTSEELTRDFGTADKSVHGTLVHIFGADRIWLARVERRQLDALVRPADHDLAKLTREWTSLGDRWKEWAASLTDDSLNEWRDYKDMKGNPHRTLLWQIGLHVVNHATHHRGQASGFLRSLGKTPPPLDLIYYYRMKSAA